jgi:hypothetical protein
MITIMTRIVHTYLFGDPENLIFATRNVKQTCNESVEEKKLPGYPRSSLPTSCSAFEDKMNQPGARLDPKLRSGHELGTDPIFYFKKK